MKFREIKPGMVIHCPKGSDAESLVSHLRAIGYDVPYHRAYLYYFIDETRVRVSDYFCVEHYDDKAITEFSDLIEPEPRFKVGDKVRVKKIDWAKKKTVPVSYIAQGYEGESFVIVSVTKCKDGALYATNVNPYNWSEEILEPADDSPINSDINSPMSAVEVLEWLAHFVTYDDYGSVFERLHDEYGDEYGFTDLVNEYTPQEIVDKITAYEAAKKKPVEVEWVDVCKIIEQTGLEKLFYDEVPLVSGNDIEVRVANTLKLYQKNYPDRKFYAVIERRCQIKEDK